MIESADSIYEIVVFKEIKGTSREFNLFVLDVIATHGMVHPCDRKPIIFLSEEDFATLGERGEYKR